MKKLFLLLSLSSTLLLAEKSGVIFGLKDNGSLSLRKAPITGTVIDKLSNENKLAILEQKDKWYKVTVQSTGKTGWVHGDWVKVLPKRKSTNTHKTNPTLEFSP